MADLKLNGITPNGVGKIKLGSADVQKIYMGSTLVWPPSSPPGPCTGYEFADKAELQTAVNLWVSNEAQAIIDYGQINTWCTGNVTDMSTLFSSKTNFNDDISNWDVSSVTNMSSMFQFAFIFDQPLNTWDVSSVTNMGTMFQFASAFNQNLNSWDVSNVTNMSGMFDNALAFNQDIGNWDVSSVIDMNAMFLGALTFNKNLSGWCVTNITSEPSAFSLSSALTPVNKPSIP
jgi:surface protein